MRDPLMEQIDRHTDPKEYEYQVNINYTVIVKATSLDTAEDMVHEQLQADGINTEDIEIIAQEVWN